MPKTFLRKIKSDFLDKRDQQLEMIERPRGTARLVAAADVEDETSVLPQDPFDLPGKRKHPLNVALLIDVAIFLLEVECVRRRRNDRIDAVVREHTQDCKRVGGICGSQIRPVHRMCTDQSRRMPTWL